jgi:hypothetical protein
LLLLLLLLCLLCLLLLLLAIARLAVGMGIWWESPPYVRWGGDDAVGMWWGCGGVGIGMKNLSPRQSQKMLKLT